MLLGNCVLLSPTFLFKRSIVATAKMRCMELTGSGARKENLISVGLWWLLIDSYLKERWECCCISCSEIHAFFLHGFNFCRAVGSPLVMDPNSICRKAKRLAGKQAELCQTQPEIVSEVAKGARLGVRECQYQFRYRRWNCTSHNKYFGKVLQQGEWRGSVSFDYMTKTVLGFILLDVFNSICEMFTPISSPLVLLAVL